MPDADRGRHRRTGQGSLLRQYRAHRMTGACESAGPPLAATHVRLTGHVQEESRKLTAEVNRVLPDGHRRQQCPEAVGDTRMRTRICAPRVVGRRRRIARSHRAACTQQFVHVRDRRPVDVFSLQPFWLFPGIRRTTASFVAMCGGQAAGRRRHVPSALIQGTRPFGEIAIGCRRDTSEQVRFTSTTMLRPTWGP